MMTQLRIGWIALATATAVCLTVPSVAPAQDGKVKDPVCLHGMELRVRKAGQPNFEPDKTPQFGVEVFKDENSGKLVFVSETGSLAAVNATTAPAPGTKIKEPLWLHALELRVRKAGEKDFTDKTKKYGIEVFRDENTGNLIYIVETGAIAVLPGTQMTPPAEVKKPTHRMALELAARKAGEKEFTDKTARYNIEVFKDENNGNLIYISDTGSIAVLPNAPAAVSRIKDPVWLQAMDLSIRKAGEKDISDKTPKYGVEVFRDDNNATLVYIDNAGNIAVLAGKQDPPMKIKDPTWRHAMDLTVRKPGEAKPTDKSPKFGVEAFRDENNSNLLYVSDTGALSVLSGK